MGLGTPHNRRSPTYFDFALHVQYLLASDVMICLGKHSTGASPINLPGLE